MGLFWLGVVGLWVGLTVMLIKLFVVHNTELSSCLTRTAREERWVHLKVSVGIWIDAVLVISVRVAYLTSSATARNHFLTVVETH